MSLSLLLNPNDNLRDAALAQGSPDLSKEILQQCVSILEFVRSAGIAFCAVPMIARLRPLFEARSAGGNTVGIVKANHALSVRACSVKE
jgi:hypothetical protein